MVTSPRLTSAALRITKKDRTPILNTITIAYDCMSLMGKNKGKVTQRPKALVGIDGDILKFMTTSKR